MTSFMWTAASVPARMIEIITPAGFERYFVELAELIATGSVSREAVDALGARYGLWFDDAWIPELIERYGLVPPWD